MTAVTLPFETWRVELTGELVVAEEALSVATVELHEAEAAHDSAKAEHQALRAAIAPLKANIASALAARIRGGDEALHDAASAAGRARAIVVAGRERCADLREALQQIDQLLAPPVAAEELTDAAD